MEDSISIFVLVAIRDCCQDEGMTKPAPSTTPKILAAQNAEGRPDRADFLRRMARPFVPRPWRQTAPGLTKSQTKNPAMKINLRFLGIKPREEWKE
ncbi:MAG: hypothetical protein ACRD5Z_12385, partial [Bryobacteraceae bacterium]